MAKWPWVQRQFSFEFPPTKFPDLLERLRGTPARLEERVRDFDPSILTRRDGEGWSIQENAAHLVDLGYLPLQRIDEIMSGADVLCAADMTNRKTNTADHNAKNMSDILSEFRADRSRLVARLDGLPESDWGKSGMHPRLKQPMRIVDIVFFDSEHDDYHLARIAELIRKWT